MFPDIRILGSTSDTAMDNISVVFLSKYEAELSLVLAIMLNAAFRRSNPLHYIVPSAFLLALDNFEAVINRKLVQHLNKNKPD